MYLALSDPTDAKGLCALVDGKAVFLPFAEAEQILLNSKDSPLWVFFDEIGQAPPSIQTAFAHWLQARTIAGRPIPENVCFVGATNRKQDKAGVSGMLEQVKNRFAPIIQVEPNLEDWVRWALANGVTIETIAFLRFRPELLHRWENQSEIKVGGPTPRGWAKLDRIHQEYDAIRLANPSEAGTIQRLEPEAFSGTVGDGAAAEYLGFLRIWRDLPDVDAVLMSPQTAPVPTDAATLYALTGALAHQVQKDSMDRFCAYSKRLPEEFSVRMVRDAVSQKPEITGTRSYVEWASSMKDLII
jgi:hypothetical protein